MLSIKGVWYRGPFEHNVFSNFAFRAVVLATALVVPTPSVAQAPPRWINRLSPSWATYTPRSILARNMGTDEDQTTAFPPHKVIGNVYSRHPDAQLVSHHHPGRTHPDQQHLREERADDSEVRDAAGF